MFSWAQVKRKSAVEMLEESKAFYVKSERVLDSKQELPHSDRFQVRSPMPGFPVRCRDPAGLGHITPHLSRSISYKEVNQSAREVPPRRQYTVKGGGESHEKHQLAIRKHFPIPLSMAAVKRFLSRPEEASQVKRVSPVPSNPYVKPAGNFLPKKNPPLVNAGALFVNNTTCKKRSPPGSSQRFSFADPVPCTCQHSNRAPELPHRMNHSLITPPPLPPKSPGLRLRQISQPVTHPEKHYLLTSKASRLEVTKKPSQWSRDNQKYPVPAAPRLSSAFLHKSLPDLNPPSKSNKSNRNKPRAASTEVSCSECGSSDLSPTSSSSVAPSSSESSAGSKMVIRRKARYGAGDRATSDYASRSPSFKYETGSLLHTTRVYWYSHADDEHRSKKRPIIRSKSDIGHNAFQNPEPPAQFASNGVPFELNHFFESCGVSNVYPDNASGRSTPVYFSSVSSVDSADRRPITEVDADELAAALQRRLLGSQPGLGEPSIVERNARIIKWIINCRKAAAAAAVAAESTPVKKTTRNLNRSFKDKQQCTQTSYYGQSTRL